MSDAAPAPDDGPILIADGVHRSFGGVRAVDVEHMEVERGSVVALIGPNGAGKTTFFNVLTGFERADGGTWRFEGHDVSGQAAYAAARVGMVRTFQTARVFPRLSVLDNIRLAAKKGVAVRLGTLADLPTFYTMYVETGERDGFIVRPYDYYHDAWGTFIGDGLAQLFLAEFEDQPLGGILLFRYGPTAWYMYGASRDAHRNLMPNYLLQWEAIRWAKQQGVTLYDWWGAPDVVDESDPMYGVYRFKDGFGAQFAPSTGAWDFPVNRRLYQVYHRIMPSYLEFRRRIHRVDTPTTPHR